jgi:aryl-alcohol dehydrogenase-like predicted oxidoreductase
METIALGKTGERVSRMCLGTMYFGSRVGEEQAFDILDRYYERGGRFLDTADNYCFWLDGFSGDESELCLGKWLKRRKNRGELFLASKCGVRPTGKNGEFEGLSGQAIRKAIEGSLKRLGVERLDLYYLHVDWRKEPLEETLETFDALVKEGVVGHIGCSNMSTWRMLKGKELSRRHGWSEFAAIQQWYSYLKPRDNADLWVQKFVDEELLDYCEAEADVAILAYTSTLGGLYKWNSIYEYNHPALNNRFFSEDNERRLSVIRAIAEERGVSPFRVVFAWMLRHRAVIIPVLGVSSVSQLEDNLAALDLSLSDEDFQRMRNAAFNGRTYETEGELSLL